MKYCLLVGLLLLFVNPKTIAQEEMNIVPNSPTVGALGKYGEWPVDYSHGLPNINIPIYTLETGSINLPISLSYHASGIKVDDEASWVGLGWSLNAGGVITRTINGKDDFAPTYIDVKTFDQIVNGDYPTYDEINSVCEKNAYDGQPLADAEPDIFSYNFAGYSGQFYLERTGIGTYKAHFIENHNGLKITDVNYQIVHGQTYFTTSTTISFTIIDNQGNKFFFQNQEQNFSGYSYYNFQKMSNSDPVNIAIDLNSSTITTLSFVSGWYLSRIESPNGNNYIDFHYSPLTRFVVSGFSGLQLYHSDEYPSPSWRSIPYFPVGSYNIPIKYISSCIKTYKLDSITTSSNIRIKFESNYERIDLVKHIPFPVPSIQHTYALSQIDIGENNKNIISWKFNYEYFNSNVTTEDVGWADNTNSFNFRLKLKSLTKVNVNTGNFSKPFLFSYYGEGENEHKMPFKHSFGNKDIYNYCNREASTTEATNPIYLFSNRNAVVDATINSINGVFQTNACYSWPPGPSGGACDMSCAIKYYSSIYSSANFSDGRDGSPDSTYAILYSLKRITYPTGGHSDFGYELNTFYRESKIGAEPSVFKRYGGGLRIKFIKTTDNLTNKTLVKEYNYHQSGIVTTAQKYVYPLLNKIINNNGNNPPTGIYPNIILTAQPILYSKPVEYGDITETNPLGSVEYKYTTSWDFRPKYESWYFGMYYSGCYTFVPFQFISDIYPYTKGWQEKPFFTGKLKSKTVYDKTNRIVQQEINTYKYIEGDGIYAMEANYWSDPEGNVRANIFKIPTGKAFLDTVYEKNYYYGENNTMCVIDTAIYEYDINHELLKEKTTYSSKNDKLRSVFKYPFDITNPEDVYTSQEVLDSLISKNIIGISLLNEDFSNNKLTKGLITTFNYYKNDKNLLFKASYLKYEGKYNTFFTIDEYNSKGNVLQYHKRSNNNVAFIWNKTGNYPIVKAENTTYEELNNWLNMLQPDMDAFLESLGDLSSEQARIDWASFNETLRGLLPNAQITTYTYIPLVGMSSKCDINGNATYYQYDNLNRLETIRDNDYNIIKHIDYHYKSNN